MFSTCFIFRQENLVDNQKCQAGFRPLCNKILILADLPVRNRKNISDSKWKKKFCQILYANHLLDVDGPMCTSKERRCTEQLWKVITNIWSIVKL